MWYRKHFVLDGRRQGATYALNLGDVIATAEVWINGSRAGLRMQRPWTFDVSPFLKDGDNVVAVKIFNTAYNQYFGVPTRYNAKQASGLLGPVTPTENY